jgi:type IV pilus assembly protein PilM
MLNFFQKPFGIDISDHSIEIISLAGSSEKPKLLALERVILKPGVVKDGQIIQKEKLGEYLKDSIRKPIFGKIKTQNLILSLSESKTFIHSFSIPEGLDDKENIKEVENEARKTFPFPLEELYYDFIINKERNVLLVAVPKKIVDGYLEVLKNCQLNPVIFETASESLARSLINGNGTVLIVDVGAATTSFSVFDEKKLILGSSLATGGERFTELIAEKLEISKSEAEELKIEIGMDPQKKNGRIFSILQEEMQKIIEKIREMNSYFEERTGKKIENIILAGGAILTLHIKEYLADNLEKEILIINPWDKVVIDDFGMKISYVIKGIKFNTKQYFKKSLKLEPIFFSVAIGAALRGLAGDYKTTGINFLKGIK